MGNPLHLFSPKVQAMIAQQHPNLGLKVPPAGLQAPIRQAKGDGMNKLERSFLDHLKRDYVGEHRAHAITLKIGNGCRYTPDFVTFQADGRLEAWEVKGGFFRDDAKVKIKVAAQQFPTIQFHLVTKGKHGTFEIHRVWP